MYWPCKHAWTLIISVWFLSRWFGQRDLADECNGFTVSAVVLISVVIVWQYWRSSAPHSTAQWVLLHGVSKWCQLNLLKFDAAFKFSHPHPVLAVHIIVKPNDNVWVCLPVLWCCWLGIGKSIWPVKTHYSTPAALLQKRVGWETLPNAWRLWKNSQLK